METIALQDAYQTLIESAVHARFSPPPSDPNEWSVELVLAHMIATNRTLIIVGAQLLDNREAAYEGGTISASLPWLKSIIDASGGIDDLLTVLRQSVGELLALAHRFDDDAASKMFPATIYDGHDGIIRNGPLSFDTLLTRLLVNHVSAHARQILALEGGNGR